MSVGGAYWICAWMGIADRRTGGRTGAQWQGLHGMQSEWAGILELRPQKSHRRTGMYTGAAICGFTAPDQVVVAHAVADLRQDEGHGDQQHQLADEGHDQRIHGLTQCLEAAAQGNARPGHAKA